MANSSASPNPVAKNGILLLLQLSLLLLLLLRLASSQQDEFFYTGFAGASLSMDGAAEIDGRGILRLTNESVRIIGHGFYPRPLRFKSFSAASGDDGIVASFSTAFAFAIIPEYPKHGGHGLAFVLSPTDSISQAMSSEYLGLFNSSNRDNATNHILAVEFDTVQDIEFRDINDNHVGVDINGLISHLPNPAAYLDSDGGYRLLNLNSGDTIQAWIDYDGNAKVLNVTLSPFSTKPNSPLITLPVDLSPILKEEMFVGFSASTDLLASSHYVFGWSFKMNGTAQSLDLSSLPSLHNPTLPSKKNVPLHTVAACLAVTLLLLAASAATIFYWIKNAKVIEPWELQHGPHSFSYRELRRATNGFSEKELLGFGGFGKVYRGVLHNSGAEVAVKRISHDSKQGIREFVAEIDTIGRLRHRNLVQLQGWCRHHNDLLLVYDYMSNGSLDHFLFSDCQPSHLPPLTPPRLRPELTWSKRYHILRCVASGLLYLHEEWEHVVLHRDVKASNVLLDADLNGRLGDFGLAKLHEHGANPSTTKVVGTLGYLAPELTRTGKASESSDVFAYGALVLEVVCGRRPIEPKAMPEELILVDWVWELWSQGRCKEVIDPRLLTDGYDIQEAEVAIKVGLLCSQPVASLRPTMREVVRYLHIGDPEVMPDVPPPPLSPTNKVAMGGPKQLRVDVVDDCFHYSEGINESSSSELDLNQIRALQFQSKPSSSRVQNNQFRVEFRVESIQISSP